MTQDRHSLTEDQRQNIIDEYQENGVLPGLREADLYRPSDANQTEWLTSVFRDLELAADDEEVITETPHDRLVLREVAREEQCPVCEEPADHVVEEPQRLKTPSQIDGYWSVCVSEGDLYVHNHGIGDYLGREKRR